MKTTDAMTDLELLELAAKAAGHTLGPEWDCYENGILVNGTGRGDGDIWNPLTDDGDALRLLASIPSLWSLAYKFGPVFEVSIAWGNGEGINIKQQVHEGDKLEMLRRAIVEAAAEIGRTMP